MAEPRAVIDIVGAEALADVLLEKMRYFWFCRSRFALGLEAPTTDGFAFLSLITLNVLLALGLVLAISRYGGDRLLLSLQDLSEPSQSDAALARRERIEAEENAWRFDQ